MDPDKRREKSHAPLVSEFAGRRTGVHIPEGRLIQDNDGFDNVDDFFGDDFDNLNRDGDDLTDAFTSNGPLATSSSKVMIPFTPDQILDIDDHYNHPSSDSPLGMNGHKSKKFYDEDNNDILGNVDVVRTITFSPDRVLAIDELDYGGKDLDLGIEDLSCKPKKGRVEDDEEIDVDTFNDQIVTEYGHDSSVIEKKNKPKRGRPPKKPHHRKIIIDQPQPEKTKRRSDEGEHLVTAHSDSASQDGEAPVKRGRGRPRKQAPPIDPSDEPGEGGEQPAAEASGKKTRPRTRSQLLQQRTAELESQKSHQRQTRRQAQEERDKKEKKDEQQEEKSPSKKGKDNKTLRVDDHHRHEHSRERHRDDHGSDRHHHSKNEKKEVVPTPSRRGRPRKNPEGDFIFGSPKRGRGRPRKQVQSESPERQEGEVDGQKLSREKATPLLWRKLRNSASRSDDLDVSVTDDQEDRTSPKDKDQEPTEKQEDAQSEEVNGDEEEEKQKLRRSSRSSSTSKKDEKDSRPNTRKRAREEEEERKTEKREKKSSASPKNAKKEALEKARRELAKKKEQKDNEKERLRRAKEREKERMLKEREKEKERKRKEKEKGERDKERKDRDSEAGGDKDTTPSEPIVSPPKRGRGRPRKYPITEPSQASDPDNKSEKESEKGKGSPKKRKREDEKDDNEEQAEKDEPSESAGDNGPNLRRGKRLRLAPLKYWKNENVKYGRRKSGGFPTVVGATPKAAETPEKKRRKIDRGNEAETDSIQFPIIIDPSTKKEETIEFGKTRNQLTAESSSKRVTTLPMFKQSSFSSDIIVLPPNRNMQKKTAETDLIYSVVKGVLHATVHESTFTVHQGGQFFVLTGNEHSFSNPSTTTECRLTCISILKPSTNAPEKKEKERESRREKEQPVLSADESADQ